MKKSIIIIFLSVIHFISGCAQKAQEPVSEIEIWKFGWKMINNSMNENDQVANLQFDSLRQMSKTLGYKFLVTGLEVKHRLGKYDEISEILSLQNEEMLKELCSKSIFTTLKPCESVTVEKPTNPELQIELIKMYINDQYVRSNLMVDLLEKYHLKKSDVIIDSFGIETDEKNLARLKEIMNDYGFPTKKTVGKDAMRGVFIMIQHSDADKEWQKSQLTNIENAVKKGDLDGQSYAYLYDRIKINSGEKQLYGTQFSSVDPVKKTATLVETEDPENLDKRRMEFGMMPFEMYKELFLKNL